MSLKFTAPRSSVSTETPALQDPLRLWNFIQRLPLLQSNVIIHLPIHRGMCFLNINKDISQESNLGLSDTMPSFSHCTWFLLRSVSSSSIKIVFVLLYFFLRRAVGDLGYWPGGEEEVRAFISEEFAGKPGPADPRTRAQTRHPYPAASLRCPFRELVACSLWFVQIMRIRTRPEDQFICVMWTRTEPNS